MDLRALTSDDAAALAALLNAAEAVDHTGENYHTDDARHELSDPELDVAADTLGILDDGLLVAYALVRTAPDHLDLEGTVHPVHRRRGLGAQLLDWAVSRARTRGLAVLRVRVVDADRGFVALVSARGAWAVRHWFDMERDLRDPELPAHRPLGVAVGRLDGPGQPVPHEELRQLHVAAFAAHWGSTPPTTERWAQWGSGSPNFRADVSVSLRDDAGVLLGCALGYEWDADTAATGVREAWLGQLGVLPQARGRGAGSALLGEFLHRAARRGYQRAALEVDSSNASGAVGLYERAGFRTARTSTSWELDLT